MTNQKISQGTELKLIKEIDYLSVGETYRALTSAYDGDVRIRDDDGDIMTLSMSEIHSSFEVGAVPEGLDEEMAKWEASVTAIQNQVFELNKQANESILKGYVPGIVLLDTVEDIDEWYDSKC